MPVPMGNMNAHSDVVESLNYYRGVLVMLEDYRRAYNVKLEAESDLANMPKSVSCPELIDTLTVANDELSTYESDIRQMLSERIEHAPENMQSDLYDTYDELFHRPEHEALDIYAVDALMLRTTVRNLSDDDRAYAIQQLRQDTRDFAFPEREVLDWEVSVPEIGQEVPDVLHDPAFAGPVSAADYNDDWGHRPFDIEQSDTPSGAGAAKGADYEFGF